MKRELRDKWVAALRSGEYKQGRGALQDTTGGYCCLGVLCRVMEIPSHYTSGGTWFGDPDQSKPSKHYLPDYVKDQVGLHGRQIFELANRNDGVAEYGKHDFNQIADYIMQNIPVED